MDIRCPKCGEPWDIDSLHDEADYLGETFQVVKTRFFAEGCGEVFGVSGCSTSKNPAAASVASLAHELMGDDIDGIASMLEDAEWMGLID